MTQAEFLREIARNCVEGAILGGETEMRELAEALRAFALAAIERNKQAEARIANRQN